MNGRLVAGRYELSALIGRGGMGQVWLGHDRTLDRRVAVKLLRPDAADPAAAGEEAGDLRRRFLRERRVTAQVSHPGLVTVHDAGSDDADLYLVMEYLDGADLADHLAEHEPYPWTWAAAVAAQLCSVLAAVHAVPVVHRDLKPRNVVVRPDGTLVVLDLGIAAVLGAETTRVTRTGSPIGSPAYMAPEQAMGSAVGPRTDLYSLGVVLHELLSGSVPFAGGSPLGTLHRHLHEPPVPLRRLRPEVPEPLESLVLRLLAKDPQQRPADAQQVYRELAPLLPAPTAQVPGAPGRPMDPTRPFRLPYAPWPDGRVARPPAHAVPEGRSVAAAVEEARRLLDVGRITQAVEVLGAALPAAAAAHGAGSPVVRALRKQYAATLMEDGRYAAALPELRALAEERQAEAGAADPQVLDLRCEAAQCLEHLGSTAEALAEYRWLLPHLEARASVQPLRPLEVRLRMGHLLLSGGDRTAARQVLLRVLQDTERLHGPRHPLAAQARHTLDWLSQVHA